MRRYQPYPSYKESGIEWLGEVPKDWETQRIKFLFHIGRGRVISQEELIDEGTYPVYSSQTKNNGCLGYIETYDFDCQQITWTTDGANAGTVFLREGKHNCTNVCGTLQAKNNDYNINFITSALQYATQFYKRPDTNGAKIMNGEMAEIFVTLPTVSEQTAIANFLDRETAKIDTLIAKQQRMIEQLGEKRSAIISHAVTKGLDPNVKMKDSGVEWLGEVPEHWNFDKFRYIFNFSKGLTITKADLIETGIPCVNYGEIHSKYGFEVSAERHALKCVDSSYIETDKSSLMSNGDFVFADTSEDLEGAGNFTHVSGDTNIFAGYHTIIARQTKNNNARFLAYLIDSKVFRTQIRLAVKGVKVFSITQAILRDSSVWLPNITEQTAIANFLDDKIGKIDTLIAKSRQAIELMKERRTALISAAVTGKIDVRGDTL